jgi:hypothetical protein
MDFADAENPRPIPVHADRRGRKDEPTAAARIEYLREENRVLRERLGGRRLGFNDDQRRRLAAKAKKLGRRLLAEIATIVTPETLLGWHRKLIARKYGGSGQRGPGRPRSNGKIETLVIWMAEENRDWGYRRILGALSNLGYQLARGTIANILTRHVWNLRPSGAERRPGKSSSAGTGN